MLKDIGHAHVLCKIAYYSRNKHRNSLAHNEIKKNDAVSLHLNKINVQLGVLFSDKILLLGNAQNNAKKLANSMKVFLLSTLHGKKLSLNLYSKPVLNMKSKYLQNALSECLGKACNSDFNIASITLDGASTNSK